MISVAKNQTNPRTKKKIKKRDDDASYWKAVKEFNAAAAKLPSAPHLVSPRFAPAEMACSVCGHPNPIQSKICGNCKSVLRPIGAPPPDEVKRVRGTLDDPLIERIWRDRNRFPKMSNHRLANPNCGHPKDAWTHDKSRGGNLLRRLR